MASIEAMLRMAASRYEAGALEDADRLCREMNQQAPACADAWHLRGVIAGSQGNVQQAVGHLRRALAIRADNPEYHYNLGHALRQQGDLESAVSCFRSSLRLRSDFAEAQMNLGSSLSLLGKLDEAAVALQRALYLKPDYAEAHYNLGIVWRNRGKLDEAAASCRQAIQLNPENAEFHCLLATTLLSKGEFSAGWEEYEWRWRKGDVHDRGFRQPLWDGQPLAGKTILVHAEQGLGDTIQFVRYLSRVKRQGGTVILECQQPLVRLLQSVAGVDHLAVAGSEPPAFEVHAPLLSLPRIFNTSLLTVPAEVPYLSVERNLAQHWAQRLARFAGPKVGICWHGNPGFVNDRVRSIPLRHFAKLGQLAGVTLVSLQKGKGLEQLPSFDPAVPLLDLSAHLNDFLVTAAVMTSLDLVISCDTAVAHLAGALGVPVWLAIPSFVTDWRWLRDREDSPWYPTMRLFRQTNDGNWNSVFERMADALRGTSGIRAGLASAAGATRGRAISEPT